MYHACAAERNAHEQNGLTLQAGHAGAHDLVDEEQVAGDDGAGVDHLLLDSDVVVDALLCRDTSLATLAINSNLNTNMSQLNSVESNHSKLALAFRFSQLWSWP